MSTNVELAIEKSGCAPQYYALEECLGEHDRSWVACKAAVTALRKCSEARAEEREALTAAAPPAKAHGGAAQGGASK